KNAALAALVAEARDTGRDAETATTLLHLALWPGLDAVYRRRLRAFRDEPDALCSEVAALFLDQLRRMDLSRVRRVAATLIRNVERDIGRLLSASWAEQAMRAPADLIESIAAEPSAWRDPERDCAALAQRIEPVIGPETDLVLDVAVRGYTQREAGAAQFLGHEAARKRYQRAIARLRASVTP
ncbi:MAG: sigma-70 family RNA polymerase sigma factor, partial [Pseudomonadota bacterium]